MHLRRPALPATLLLACALAHGAAHAVTYHVSTSGSDAASRSGLSTSAAWRSLAYACERVPAGSHVIKLGPGTFIASETCKARQGVTIRGNGRSGSQRTVLKPANTARWDYSTAGCTNVRDGYLISVHHTAERPAHDVTIEAIEFSGEPAGTANGAIASSRANGLRIRDVAVREFRHSGIYLEHAQDAIVEDSELVNAATNQICDASRLGSLSTKYVSRLTVRNNLFRTTRNAGYGYRGRSATDAKIHANVFDILPSQDHFSMEIAHGGGDYGVAVFDNVMTNTVSLVRSHDKTDAPSKGFPYSIRVHDNVISNAYAIEGSRRYLEIDHNYFLSSFGSGSTYMDHGTEGMLGPVAIHHNVSANVTHSFFHKNGGGGKSVGSNFSIYNNTVFLSPDVAHVRFLEFHNGASGENYRVFNNVVVGPTKGSPRRAVTGAANIGLLFRNNLYRNLVNMPDGNIDADPGLAMAGTLPVPYFLPASASSAVVDAGWEVPGMDYLGDAPDLGAYEHGAVRLEAESLPYSTSPGVVPSVWSGGEGSGGKVLFVNTSQPGESITFRLPPQTASAYSLRVGVRSMSNRGIWLARRSALGEGGLKGPFGQETPRVQQRYPIDTYSPTVLHEEISLGEFVPTGTGDQLLTFEMLRKNAESSGYQMAIDYLILVPRTSPLRDRVMSAPLPAMTR